MKIIGGSEEILLNAVRSYGLKVPPNGALNMNRSLYLTIGYLQRNKYDDLEFKFYGW